MTIPQVIIPWFGDCPHRAAALSWVVSRYGDMGWPVQVVKLEGDLQRTKAVAIRLGVEQARDGIVVVGDADSWSDGTPDAVQAVAGGAPWARPHGRVHRLAKAATRRVLDGAIPSTEMTLERRPYRGTGGGAIVVARRETLLDVPPDRRFRGWGCEDGAWRDALRTLAGMEWDEARAPLWHLWHPSPARHGGRRASAANRQLAKRYVAARGDARAMRDLVAAG